MRSTYTGKLKTSFHGDKLWLLSAIESFVRFFEPNDVPQNSGTIKTTFANLEILVCNKQQIFCILTKMNEDHINPSLRELKKPINNLTERTKFAFENERSGENKLLNY